MHLSAAWLYRRGDRAGAILLPAGHNQAALELSRGPALAEPSRIERSGPLYETLHGDPTFEKLMEVARQRDERFRSKFLGSGR